MLIHRRLTRPKALGLCFVWMYAITFGVLLTAGPLLLVFLATLIDDATNPRHPLELVVEAYRDLVTLEWIPRRLDDEFLWMVGLLTGWVAIQVAFLSPLIGRPRVDGEGRSMLPSVLMSTLIATTGTALLWVAVVEMAVALTVRDTADFRDRYHEVVFAGWFGGMAIWAIGGLVWYRLLVSAGSRYDPTGLDRHLRRLLAGSAVEAALGTVAILTLRRRDDCVCATGSFAALVYSLLVLVWLCGPWTVLLLTRNARSRWRQEACSGCGYLRRPGSTRCPECGHMFGDARTSDPGGPHP